MPVSLTADDLMDYTAWERQKWHDRLRPEGDDVLKISTGPNGDRFTTVGDLIRHVFSAEQRYVDRLSGRALADTADIPNDSIEALFRFGQQSRAELRGFVASFPAQDWDVPQDLKMHNSVLTMTPRKIVVHVLLHETRHWAQVATFLRLNGVTDGFHDFLLSPVMGGTVRHEAVGARPRSLVDKIDSRTRIVVGLSKASMGSRVTTQVLIVGGGPVGLTLAIDLAQRGIHVTVVETRAPGEPPSVRCNHVAARTMEIFRRLGLVRAVRDAGLPAHYPNDVAFRTTAVGMELSRIPIPCRAERYRAQGGPDTWWPTPEPPHRINQIYLEPILFAHATATPRLSIVNRARAVDFGQTERGVRATIESLDGGGTEEILAGYLIGCDGARSVVRHIMGARFSGDAVVMQTQSTDIRAPQLLDRIPRPAWLSVSLNPRCSGYLFAIDGKERWLIHNWRPPSEDLTTLDRDRCIRQILGVESSFTFEILGQEDWTGRRMIADRFRDRRVFLCGDAAHIWVPFAGYGMNAGIADAMNLSWKLAGVLNGWAHPAILDAYELERQPVTEQVSRYAMGTSLARESLGKALPDTLEAPGPDGDAARARIGKEAYQLNVGQFCCGGLNFGYFYDASPIVAYDGEQAPEYSMDDFKQSTVPGCRTPHLWLRDGRSLYDAVGPEFTLLRLDPAVETAGFVAAAGQRGLPLAVLDVDADDSASLYRHRLVLSRPDQHVAWRGDEPPQDPSGLIDRVRGASPDRSDRRE